MLGHNAVHNVALNSIFLHHPPNPRRRLIIIVIIYASKVKVYSELLIQGKPRQMLCGIPVSILGNWNCQMKQAVITTESSRKNTRPSCVHFTFILLGLVSPSMATTGVGCKESITVAVGELVEAGEVGNFPL